MGLPGADLYQLPVRYPAVYERGAASQVTRMGVERDGAAVPVTGGTFQLVGPGGVVIASGDVEIDDGVATFEVTAAHLEEVGFTKGCREVWALVTGEGEDAVQHRQTRPAAVCKYRLEPPTGHGRIVATHKLLSAQLSGVATSLQDFIDSAWGKVLRRLWGMQQWPEQIVDNDQLIEVCEEQVLVDVYELLAATPDDVNWKKMEMHRGGLSDAWSRVSFRRDADQDGVADSEDRNGLGGVIHMNGAPGTFLPSWS